MTDTPSFAGAHAALLAARVAEDTYDAETWRPAYDRWTIDKTPIPKEADAEIERLQEARCDAEVVAIMTPADSIADVGSKIELAQKRWEGFDIPDDWHSAIMGDISGLQTRFAEAWLEKWVSHGGSALLCDDGKVQLGFPTYELSPEYEGRGCAQTGAGSSLFDGRYYGTMNTMVDCLKIVPGGVDIIKAHMRATGQRAIFRAREGEAA